MMNFLSSALLRSRNNNGTIVALLLLLVDSSHAFLLPTGSPLRRSDPLRSLPTPLDTLTSGLASICRLPRGVDVVAAISPPAFRFTRLYDIENSSDCRRVRELLTELDVCVERIIPSASNSRVFTDPTYAYALPNGTVIPRLVVVEESSGAETTLSGVDEVTAYLQGLLQIPNAEEEEDTNSSTNEAVQILQAMGLVVAGWLRAGRGEQVCTAANLQQQTSSKQQLVLYSYEGNQFCRLVREVLTELDLPYELRNAGKGSPRRAELAEISGSTQCPCLVVVQDGDSPANNKKDSTVILESAEIIRYLYQNYARWTPPNTALRWASDTVLPLVRPLLAATTPLLAASSSQNDDEYASRLAKTKDDIQQTIQSAPVVIYTYEWSPYSVQAKELLDTLGIEYQDIRLGRTWIVPGADPYTRAALLDMTGQSSMPHVFVGGTSVGGLFSGTPGLVPALEAGTLLPMLQEAVSSPTSTTPVV